MSCLADLQAPVLLHASGSPPAGVEATALYDRPNLHYDRPNLQNMTLETVLIKYYQGATFRNSPDFGGGGSPV